MKYRREYSFGELRATVKDLYEAGRWECPTLTKEEQAKIWEEVRDAAKIKKGTATKLGVGS